MAKLANVIQTLAAYTKPAVKTAKLSVFTKNVGDHLKLILRKQPKVKLDIQQIYDTASPPRGWDESAVIKGELATTHGPVPFFLQLNAVPGTLSGYALIDGVTTPIRGSSIPVAMSRLADELSEHV